MSKAFAAMAALLLITGACSATAPNDPVYSPLTDVSIDAPLADAATPSDTGAGQEDSTTLDVAGPDVTPLDAATLDAPLGADVQQTPDAPIGTDAPVATDSAVDVDGSVGQDTAQPACPASCDDGDPCTADTCAPFTGVCQHAANPGCKPGAAPCQSTQDCKQGVCNPVTLMCAECVASADCGAGKACAQNNTCQPAISCVSDSQCKASKQVCNKTKAICVDCQTANDCGAGSVCKADLCAPAPKTCLSSKDCPGVCDKQAGVCVNCLTDADCPTEAYCAAGSLCVPDLCSGAACVGSVHFACAANGSAYAGPKVCDDGNACTSDTCVTGSGCSFVSGNLPCNDGDACTVGDTCGAGKCKAGAAVSCDDKQACTLDTCDAQKGCQHAASDAACDDANACTLDACAVGGCTHAAGGTICDDGNLCTGDGKCGAGSCGAGTAISCDDKNECTLDTCDGKTGACVHAAQAGCVPAASPPCTTNADCAAGVCDPAALACVGCLSSANCASGSICLKHSCVAATACVSDTQCKTTKQVCSGWYKACVDCNSATDCGLSEACVDSKCVAAPACKSSKDCPKVCNLQAGVCVECTTSADCAGNQICDASHTCVAKICTGQACAGKQLYPCRPDGTGYYPAATCADGNLCTADACDAAQGCVFTPKFDASLPELPLDALDNNCNGQTDETAPAVCDGNLLTSADADFAAAIDLCGGVVSSTFTTLSDPKAHAILGKFGAKNLPQLGNRLVALSTGIALPEGVTGYAEPQSGTDWKKSSTYPAASQCKTVGTAAHDLIEWKLVLTVPASAQSLDFDFFFLSTEFPEYLSSTFNDHLLVLLDSNAMKGNILFDDTGDCFTATKELFKVCKGCPLTDALLAGTGYEVLGSGGDPAGGGTGWMSVGAPVMPGETITLRFLLFDDGDGIYDTAVLLDRFRWSGAKLTKPTLVSKP